MRPDSRDDFDSLHDLFDLTLTRRERDQLLRRRRAVRPIDSVHVEIDGVRYVNFSSNNYLGLTHHPRVIAAVQSAATEFGVGAAASPLITGYTSAHASAETALAKWKGTEAAVVLPSGYQANQAAVQTLAAVAEASDRSVRFLLDRLAHASLIDAVRDTRLPFRVFPHNDHDKLQRLLGRREDDALDVVVTESIFSMDGDAAPLRELAALKRAHGFFFLLDEAHGSGVYGEHGAGYAAELGVSDVADACVVTLSKALGVAGGAICASKEFCEAVVNFGRAYLYSTSVPPTTAAACEAALAVMRDEPQRQQRVRALARRVRGAMGLQGDGDSPIVPIVLRSESAAVDAAERLREKGMLVLPIRPPTVPRGTSRLRVTLSCDHSDEEVGRLSEVLSKLCAVDAL
jgi:8-amino-7-oxononanoate synthase